MNPISPLRIGLILAIFLLTGLASMASAQATASPTPTVSVAPSPEASLVPSATQDPAPTSEPEISQTSPVVEGSFDDLFDNAQDVTTETTPSPGQGPGVLARVEAPHGIQFTGSVEAKAGMYSGWLDLPDAGADILKTLDAAGGYGFSLDLNLSARVDSTFLVFAGFAFDYPHFDITTSQIFIDYTLANTLYVRLGKQTISWGMGKFFNHGDIIPDADLSLQISLPLDPFTFVVVAQGDEDYYGQDWGSDVSLRSTEYAGKVEFRLPAAELWTAIRYQENNPLRLTGGASFSFLGIDAKAELFLEAPGETNGVDFAVETDWDWKLDTSLFYEIPAPRIQLFAEYAFDADQDHLAIDHRTAFSVRLPDLGGGVQAGLSWVHVFTDASGYLLAGLQFPVWDHLSFKLGLLGRYGADGTTGRTYDPLDEKLPVYQAALILGLVLKAPF